MILKEEFLDMIEREIRYWEARLVSTVPDDKIEIMDFILKYEKLRDTVLKSSRRKYPINKEDKI